VQRPPVVILSGVRWDFLWQRHQALAALFAHAGYPTTFVETTGLANPHPRAPTLRKIASRLGRAGGEGASTEEGLTVYSPLAAPPTYTVFRWLNRRFFVPRVVGDLRKKSAEAIVIAYPPTRTTLDVISGLRPRLVLYDCSDDYAHFPGAPRDVAETERELLCRADLVSCTSTWLLERVRAARPDAFLSGPAVDYERFAVLQGAPISGGGIRTVCFFGSLGAERIDLRALRAIVEAGFEVRIVGTLGRVDRNLLELPGIDYRGEVPHAKLPAALAGVDAFVLPYRLGDLTRGISPAKTYECLATGRPVVAAPLPALEGLAGYVYLAGRPGEYVEVLQNLKNLETQERRRERIELARRNSWEARFEEIEGTLWRAL
jgi:glycosyltransferase involved in cell wall biosynthesis